MRMKITLLLILSCTSCFGAGQSQQCKLKLDIQLPQAMEYQSHEYIAIYTNRNGRVEKYILSKKGEQNFYLFAMNADRAIKLKLNANYIQEVWDNIKGLDFDAYSDIKNEDANKFGHLVCGELEISSNFYNQTFLMDDVHHPSLKEDLNKFEEKGIYKFKGDRLEDIYYYLGAKLTSQVANFNNHDFTFDAEDKSVLFYKEF